jgi:hypothetical protein
MGLPSVSAVAIPAGTKQAAHIKNMINPAIIDFFKISTSNWYQAQNQIPCI